MKFKVGDKVTHKSWVHFDYEYYFEVEQICDDFYSGKYVKIHKKTGKIVLKWTNALNQIYSECFIYKERKKSHLPEFL